MKQRKRTAYLFLNEKQRLSYINQGIQTNRLTWLNLPPLPSGNGFLSIVDGGYTSRITRNNRFIVSIELAPYNMYSTDLIDVPMTTTDPTRTVFHFNWSNPFDKQTKIPIHTNDLKNITFRFNFNQEVTDRPFTNNSDFFNFVLKFEYI